MKSKWILAVLAALALTPMGHGQGIDAYLKTRRSLKITQAVGVEALETVVGQRTVEVEGRICGYSAVGDRTVLLLECSDGQTLEIQTKEVPEWLRGNDVDARLIVKAFRPDETSALSATLIAVAPGYQIRQKEKAEAARTGKVASKPPSRGASNSNRTPSRTVDLPASQATPVYASFIKKRNPRLSDSEALRIAQGVVGFSLKYGVDARLVMAMVLVESGFNPNATSRAGAMGLGQLMPGTAQGMGVSNAYDSIDNLYGTVRLIRGHLSKYSKSHGDSFEALVLALAAYNAGGGAVKKYGGVPPYRETQNYVRKVTAYYRALCGN